MHLKLIAGALCATFIAATPAYAQCAPQKAQTAHAVQATQNDIVDIARSAGQFETLTAALGAAGLVQTLEGDGPFTVFAPTDEAFRALPPGTVERLLRPENRAELVRVLSYHVVPGRIASTDLAGRQVRPVTVAGPGLDVDARQGVSVNQARVVQADIAASNGVVHVIDRVLLPPAH